MCISPVVLMQYVTVKQSVSTQHFIIIYEATCSRCTRQPSSGFTFQNFLPWIDFQFL